MNEIEQIKQELEQQRKLCGYFSEQGEYWFRKWQRYHNRLVHARLLLKELRQAVQIIQDKQR